MKRKIRQYIKMILQHFLLPLVYDLHRFGRTDKSLVVFADAHHANRPESMRLLYHALVKKGIRVKEYYYDSAKLSAFGQLKAAVQFMGLYAKAGTVVICDNFLPVSSARKKKHTKVIQLWHGPGAFKKFGYDTEDDIPSWYRGNVFKNYDLVTVSGRAAVKPFQSAMRQPDGVVKPVGISRMDVLKSEKYIEKCREEFFSLYPEAEGKKILVYAPTFRGNAGDPRTEGFREVKALKHTIGDDWFILICPHPHLYAKLDADMIPKLPTERALAAADVFVTDYSSVFYDACVLEKKMLFFTPDLNEYMTGRGFYISMAELPGEVVVEEERLREAVLRAYENYDFHYQRQFVHSYLGACDGHATERIIRFIEGRK